MGEAWEKITKVIADVSRGGGEFGNWLITWPNNLPLGTKGFPGGEERGKLYRLNIK